MEPQTAAHNSREEAILMKRLLIPVILMALACLLTGCAGNTEADAAPSASPMASTDPAGMPDLMPDNGTENGTAPMGEAGAAGSTINTMVGVTTAAKARDVVEKIEEELSRLSEVDEAQVLVAGTTAVVALDFDAQYQAGVTDRLEKMVKERIDGVVTGIENVIVTDDRDVAATLDQLGDRLDGAADMTDLEAELRKLMERVRNAA